MVELMSKPLPEAKIKVREDAKTKLYVGELKGLKGSIDSELARTDVTKEELAKTVRSYMMAHDRDGMRPAGGWMAAAKAALTGYLDGNAVLANNFVNMAFLEASADQIFDVIQDLEKLHQKSNSPKHQLQIGQSESRRRELALKLVDTLAPVANIPTRRHACGGE
jgi:hypothetical protein